MSEAKLKDDEETPDDEVEESRMSFVEHLKELRKRLFYTVVAIFALTLALFALREELFYYITLPLKDITDQQMQVLGPVEMFVTYLKLAVLAAIFTGAPWLLLQAWLFIAPGLYSHEKKWLAPFVILGSLFFIGGGAFGYFLVLPLGFEQLVAMVPDTVETNFRVSEYVGLVIRLLLAFGVVFELPLVMWILSAAGIVGPKAFAKVRKFWLVIAVVIAAFLTPPDPLTQIMMAVPLVIFFEVGMIGSHILYRKDEDPEED